MTEYTRRDAVKMLGATAVTAGLTGCVSGGSNNETGSDGDPGDGGDPEGGPEPVDGGSNSPSSGQQHESAYDHPKLSEPLDGEAPVYQYWEEEDREILGVPEEFIAYESGDPSIEGGVINIGLTGDRYSPLKIEEFELNSEGKITEFAGKERLDEKDIRYNFVDRSLYRLSLNDKGDTIVVEMDTDELPREEEL